MKNPSFLTSEKMWKGSLIAISYFLLAACMQHEESLSPRNHNVINDLISPQSNGVGSSMKNTFTAHLKSRNELPTGSVESQGQGQAIFQLNDDGMSLDYKLIVANIDNVTQAHIHCGDATQNGSVVVFLFGFVTGGVDVNGVLAEGTITGDNMRPSPASCPDLDTFEELLQRLRDGTAYVNVHTVQYPGGEIRGQIK